MLTSILGCILVMAAATEAYDYCTMMCPVGISHIACKNNGLISSNCGAFPLFYAPEYKDVGDIVAMLNKYRNEVASGNLLSNGYLAANRMSTLQWDDRLATMAGYSAKSCEGNPDRKCQNTCQYPYNDQLIIEYPFTVTLTPAENVMAALRSVAEELQGSPSPPKFNKMIRQYNTHIGCAAIMYIVDFRLVVTCNFGANLSTSLRYQEGTTASLCTTGTNPEYPALCSANEKYASINFCGI